MIGPKPNWIIAGRAALLVAVAALASGCSQSIVLDGCTYDQAWVAAKKVVEAYQHDEDAGPRLFGGAPNDPIAPVADKASGRLMVATERFMNDDGRLIAQLTDQGDGRVSVSVQCYRMPSRARWYRSRSQTTERHVLREIRRLCQPK